MTGAKFLLPALAVAGVALAVAMVVRGDKAAQISPPSVAAPDVPFAASVAGEGIVETSTGNIAVGTPASGIVTAIYVKWGDRVAAGDPLFKIDDRDMQGQLLLADAQVKVAQANLAKTMNLLKIAEKLTVGRSIPEVERENRRYDVGIKRAELASARARVAQIRIEIERHTVRAPVAGRILQINTRLGEFAESGALNPPLMLLGNDNPLYLRVNVDENEASRVHADAPAVAFVRGNPSLKTALTFVRFEPYIVPKTSLTGASTERPDVRVLQVIYRFDRGTLPVYVGQLMDAYIKAAPLSDAAARTQARSAGSP